VFEDGVDLNDGETTDLPYTIWMTPLDTAHAVDIPSPTTGETVVTNPAIPGLALHLPAGTVIHDRQGNVVHKISITPVAADKPPFPLPKFVNIPVYFTIQPGGSIVGPEGAELVYPNWAAQPPGVKTDFWDYNPSGGGWWVYGQGTADLYNGTYLASAHQYTEADLYTPSGAKTHYVRTSSGTSFSDAAFDAQTTAGPYFHSHLAWNGFGWDLTLNNGTVLVYGELT